MRRFAGPVRDLRVVARSVPTDLPRRGAADRRRRACAGERDDVDARPAVHEPADVLGSDATLDVNLNNMTLIERRPRQLPKLRRQGVAESQRGGAAASARRRATPSPTPPASQRFYPGIGASPARPVRRRRCRRGAAGERRRRARRRGLVRRDPGAERADPAARAPWLAERRRDVRRWSPGPTGFLGAAVVARLRADGVAVRALVRPRTRQRGRRADRWRPARRRRSLRARGRRASTA